MKAPGRGLTFFGSGWYSRKLERTVPEGLREYKKQEKLFYLRFIAALKALWGKTAGLFVSLYSKGRQRLSLAVIPHSEKPARSVTLSQFALVFLLLLTGIVLIFSIASAGRYALTAAQLAAVARERDDLRDTIDRLRDGVQTLASSALKFEREMTTLQDISKTNSAGTGSKPSSVTASSQSDALRTAGLSGLLSIPDNPGLAGREIAQLEKISSFLDASVPDVERISVLLAGQQDILTEIPNIWPVQGGIGHISMYFGQNENPFSAGVWYLHNGIDISTFRTGDVILASADGKVIDASYDPSLGNSITIQHSHGFLTRYGHLKSIKVKKGQIVSQGQAIGTLGNTGITTGPHLHYEVHLGTSVIDPLRFLNIRKAQAVRPAP